MFPNCGGGGSFTTGKGKKTGCEKAEGGGFGFWRPGTVSERTVKAETEGKKSLGVLVGRRAGEGWWVRT